MVLRITLIVLMAMLTRSVFAEVSDPRREGAALTSAFHEGRIDEVWLRLSPRMQVALKSRDDFAEFKEQVNEQLGAESMVIEEVVHRDHGLTIYRRRAHFGKVPEVILVQWVIDARGEVQGFVIRSEESTPRVEAPSVRLDYRTRTNLRLPVEEAFDVLWGGRTVAQNYHAVDSNQRFAIDFLIMRKGRTHRGNGTRNEDYFCFGKPIVAPGAGTVVEVITDLADNEPGQRNAEHGTGNRVVLAHGKSEYSVLAHLRQGSTHVKVGDKVRAGDRLGECGNSGNSSEAHLHYQLQDGPAFGASSGLPVQFLDYLADGELVSRGEPIQGQRIQPATQP